MKPLFFMPVPSPALTYARRELERGGVVFAREPGPAVTHLLLPCPLKEALTLPPNTEGAVLVGGNLDRPELAGYPKLDLLQNCGYVAQNAAITAHCALALAMEHLPVTLAGQRVLVIGWGRIGKCLSRLLQALGARVTVAARKETDRAMAGALELEALPVEGLCPEGFRVVFNTAPAPVLAHCREDCVNIELASTPGLGGAHIIDGRGLPGRMAPESAGALMAQTILKELEGAL